MELENVSLSNNDLTNGQSNRANQESQQMTTNSPKPGDENEVELENINSPSNAKSGNNQNNNQNVDANHCARNFFCWCCSCCSCLK